MGKIGEIVLKARFDGSEAAKKIRDLLQQSTDAQKKIAQQTVTSNRQVAASVLQAEKIRTQESRTLINVQRAHESVARAAVNEARTQKELARAHDANAKAILSESRTQIALRREVERTEAAEKKRREQEEKANKPKMSAFAQAVYTSRFSIGKAQPLVGKTAEAFGLDTSKGSTLALAAAGLVTNFAGQAAIQTLQFLDSATQKASDLGEAINKADQIFKGSSKDVQDWASNAVDNIGLTRKEAIDAASSLGNLFHQTGSSYAESAKQAEKLSERGADLASLFNITVPEALEKLQAGLVGESRPLRELGIFLSDARVQAEGLALGFGKIPPNAEKVSIAQQALDIATANAARTQKKYGEGSIEAARANQAVEKANIAVQRALSGTKSQLTDAQKLQARYAIILRDSAAAAGDFKRTSGEAANSQRILTARITELETEIGQRFLPLRKDILSFFNDISKGALGAVRNFGAWIDEYKRLHKEKADAEARGSDAYAFVNVKGQVAKNTDQVGTQLGRLMVQKQLLREEGYRAKYGEYPQAGWDATPGNQVLRNAVSPEQRTMALGRFQLFKNSSVASQSDVRNALDIVNAEIVEMRKKRDNLRQMDNITGAKSTTAYMLADTILHPSVTSGDDSNATDGLGTGTHHPAAATGGLYSGADRNAAERKAESTAEKQRRLNEAAIKRAMKELSTQQTAYQKTVRNGEVISFQDMLDRIKKSGTSYDSKDLKSPLPQTALMRSAIISMTDRDQILKKYDQLKKTNPKAAEPFLASTMGNVQQQEDKRRKDVQKAIDIGLERERKAREKAAKDAENYATGFREGQSKATDIFADVVDAAKDFAEKLNQDYREFLTADEENLRYRQEMAVQAGSFADSMKLRQAIFDSQTRQIAQSYSEAVFAAQGNPDALNAANLRRDTAMMQIRRDAQQGIASDILGQTPDALRGSVQNVAGNILRGAADGHGSLLDQLQSAFGQVGQVAGETFADYLQQRFVNGNLGKLFDQLAQKLVAGGANAGQAIAIGANALAQAASLLAGSGKKRSGGILGGLLGLGIAAATGGTGAALLTGFSVGSQLGQGNLLGAALSFGSSTLGSVPKIAGGNVNLSGIKVPTFADGGTTGAGRLIRAGEAGDELAFSFGRVGMLSNGYYRPTQDTTILPHDVSQKLINTAAQMAGGDGLPVRGGTVNAYYYGDVYDRQDVETNERHLLQLKRARG